MGTKGPRFGDKRGWGQTRGDGDEGPQVGDKSWGQRGPRFGDKRGWGQTRGDGDKQGGMGTNKGVPSLEAKVLRLGTRVEDKMWGQRNPRFGDKKGWGQEGLQLGDKGLQVGDKSWGQRGPRFGDKGPQVGDKRWGRVPRLGSKALV